MWPPCSAWSMPSSSAPRTSAPAPSYAASSSVTLPSAPGCGHLARTARFWDDAPRPSPGPRGQALLGPGKPPALLLPSSWTQLLLSPHEPESSKQYLSFTIFLDTFSTFIFLENSYSSFEMLLRCHFFHKASLDHSGQGKHSSVSWAYLYFLHRSYWIITVFYNLSSLRVKTVSYCIFLFSWNND